MPTAPIPLQVNNMPMMALVNPVYDCLFRLAQPDSLSEEEEVGGAGTVGLVPAHCPDPLKQESSVGGAPGRRWARCKASWRLSRIQSTPNLLAQGLPLQEGSLSDRNDGGSAATAGPCRVGKDDRSGAAPSQAGPRQVPLCPAYPVALQVDCLVLQLHRVGEQLERMNGQRMEELFILLRDGFLLPAGLSSLAQLLLLEIIEFRAAGWTTSPAAHKYYYSELPD